MSVSILELLQNNRFEQDTAGAGKEYTFSLVGAAGPILEFSGEIVDLEITVADEKFQFNTIEFSVIKENKYIAGIFLYMEGFEKIHKKDVYSSINHHTYRKSNIEFVMKYANVVCPNTLFYRSFSLLTYYVFNEEEEVELLLEPVGAAAAAMCAMKRAGAGDDAV